MANNAWLLLGLEPTNDQRAIRKAYAAKLKVTRPDDDPVGFQALVAARDQAIWEAQYSMLAYPDGLDDEPMPEDAAVEHDAGEGAAAPAPAESAAAEIPLPQIAVVEQALEPEPAIDPAHAAEPPPLQGPETVPEPLPQPVDDPQAGSAPVDPSLSYVEQSAVTVADISAMLHELSVPSPFASTRTRWSRIFDMSDLAPLEEHEDIMALICQRLVFDLRQHVGELPNISIINLRGPSGSTGPFGDYADILKDFVWRYQLYHEDSILRRYLPEADVLYLLDCMMLVLGRSRQQSEAPPQFKMGSQTVPEIDPDFIEAAYGQDADMRSYYYKSRTQVKLPSGLSLLALLFPFPWATYHRLFGLSGLFGVLTVIIGVVGININDSADRGYITLILIVYLVSVLVVFSNAKTLRLRELARVIQAIQSRDVTHEEHIAMVRKATRANRIGAALALVVQALVIGLIVFVSLTKSIPPFLNTPFV